jgi:tetratricopeptide (TPR) repeat protein
MWQWVTIVGLAAVLVLAFAVAIGAADRHIPRRPPNLLPNQIEAWATPMPSDEGIGSAAAAVENPSCMLWAILEMHRAEEYDAAIRAWNELTLPPETEVWKLIALAQASIATERLNQAEELLGRALELQPENALAFYFRGILRMQQARHAYDWPGELGSPRIRLALLTPRQIVPNTKSMYEFAATIDFEWSIEFSRFVPIDEGLLSDCCSAEPYFEPTVADLLRALGAEDLEAKAHNTLGTLFLERGALELAEQHLDRAAQGRLEVASGYRELVVKYQACGRHLDALRAGLKASAYSGGRLHPLVDALHGWYEDLKRQ